MRHAVLTPFFGQLRDRFATYHEPQSLEAKLRLAAAIPGVTGVEVIYPDEVRVAADVGDELQRLGLTIAAVNVNLKGERAFHLGALTAPDPGVRRCAVDLLRAGKRLAAELGTRVTCAPLADGYDYPLQVDYRRVWARLVDAVGEAAAFMPDVPLHIEHKPAEPRTRGLLDTPAKVLRLCRDVRQATLGITLNTGHVLAGGGSPAAALAEVLAARVPFYIHTGDATVAWDWDLGVGTTHPWAWAEFLFWLRVDGYDGWLTADTFPTRVDASALFAANIAVTNRVCQWLDRLDTSRVLDALDTQSARPMLQELERWFPHSA